MSEISQQNIEFYLSTKNPCPYLENKNERKLFTHLSGHKALVQMQLLSEHGFRRSQNIIYRPNCKNCSECKSTRVKIDAFELSKSQKRIINKNKDIKAIICETKVSDEHYELFQKYLNERHKDGNMAAMSFDEFNDMMTDTPVNSAIVEYHLKDGKKDVLVAVVLLDILLDGASMVYSFFDPRFDKKSLGVFMILDNILRLKEKKQKHLYLGYWVKGSKTMAYKINYKPIEFYSEGKGWQKLNK